MSPLEGCCMSDHICMDIKHYILVLYIRFFRICLTTEKTFSPCKTDEFYCSFKGKMTQGIRKLQAPQRSLIHHHLRLEPVSHYRSER